MDLVSRVATVILATFDDEHAVHGCRSVDETAARLAGLDVPEVIVKRGAEGALVFTEGGAVPVSAYAVERVVDTTAAGDSFAGGYLAARIAGRPPVEAAGLAADVAATVVNHLRAIIPESEHLISCTRTVPALILRLALSRLPPNQTAVMSPRITLRPQAILALTACRTMQLAIVVCR